MANEIRQAVTRGGAPGWVTRALLPMVLVIATCFAFWPARHHSYIMLDDPQYILVNPHVSEGLTWSGFSWALTTLHASNWHPVTWLSHMVDCEVFGVDAPAGHHLVSIGIHALNAALVYFLLMGTTHRPWSSLAVAAMFALHPLRVESVAWIAERKDVLSACFGLLAMCMYVKYVRTPRLWRYALVAVLMALSLMSKPTLVTLPAVLLLLDLWPLNRIEVRQPWRSIVRRVVRLALEKAPLVVLSIGSSAVTILAQDRAMTSMRMLDGSDRIMLATTGLSRYIDLTLWPQSLSVLYPVQRWPTWQWLPAVALAIAVTLLCVSQWRRWPVVCVGWLWFVGTLVPTIGIVHVGAQSIADRYTYFPSIGLHLAIIWPLCDLASMRSMAVRWGLALVLCAATAALVMTTRMQLRYWRDSETLFRRSLDVTGPNWFLHNALGTEYMNRLDNHAAIDQFKAAVVIEPGAWDAWRNLGATTARVGRFNDSIVAYRHSLTLRPDGPNQDESFNNLAALLLTNPDASQRNPSEALSLAERACRLSRRQNPAHLDTLAAAYAQNGRFDDAVSTATHALERAIAEGRTGLAKIIEARLAHYRRGEPY